MKNAGKRYYPLSELRNKKTAYRSKNFSADLPAGIATRRWIN